MRSGVWRSKWFIAILSIIILATTIFLLVLRIDFGHREDAVLKYFSQQEGIARCFR